MAVIKAKFYGDKKLEDGRVQQFYSNNGEFEALPTIFSIVIDPTGPFGPATYDYAIQGELTLVRLNPPKKD